MFGLDQVNMQVSLVQVYHLDLSISVVQWSIGLFAKQVRWITSIFGISLACIYLVLYINNRTKIRLNMILNETGLTMTYFC